MTAEDQFDMLFGKEPATESKTNDMLDILGDDAIVAIDSKVEDAAIVDDAIVFDDAIITEAPEEKKTNEAILAAAKSKPLWQEEDRQVFTQAQLLAAFEPTPDIDFSLFDEDYMSVFEVFAQHAQKPFNMEKSLVEQVDVYKFQDRGGVAKDRRYA